MNGSFLGVLGGVSSVNWK